MSRITSVGSWRSMLYEPSSIPRPTLLRWLSGFVFGAFLLVYVPWPSSRNVDSKNQPTELQVPGDLETRALARFDELVEREKIFYEPTESEYYTENGFEFEFRITSIFKKKPVLKSDDPGRSKAGGPFIDPDPEEVITELGTSHRLLVNKYCIYRPMLVIPTTEYALQTDDLDISDIEAAWMVLKALTTPSIVIYNCGVNAGSSQGHKHLQIFPAPAHRLWPSRTDSHDGKPQDEFPEISKSALSNLDVATRISHVPFKHFVLRLSSDSTPGQVFAAYKRLLDHSRTALANSGAESKDYNVVLTADWIVVIPRRTAGPGGPFGANAAGMLGMVTVPDQHEREWWAELGYTKYLEQLGVPFEA